MATHKLWRWLCIALGSALIAFWMHTPLIAAAQVFTVTTTADAGAGSLRQAMLDANANPGVDTINFNIAGDGVKTISLLSELPTVTEGVLIDGLSQPGSGCANGLPATLLIELDGTNAGLAVGLHLASGSATITGLVINRFSSDGIFIDGGDGHVVACNYIGTDPTGTIGRTNGGRGVLIFGSSDNVIGLVLGQTVRGNLISHNNVGIMLESTPDRPSNDNLIQANRIGTDANGTADLGNFSRGVWLRSFGQSVSGNVVGGTATGAGNLVSGNGLGGIELVGSLVSENTIAGNRVGVNRTATAALSNDGPSGGIRISAGANNNLIGGDTPSARNIIAANKNQNVLIKDAPSQNNRVQGNYIGLGVDGATKLGTTPIGVLIDGAPNNLVGGSQLEDVTNFISGHSQSNIYLTGETATGNHIEGNAVGFIVGGGVLTNSDVGIYVQDAPDNTIGGTASAFGNRLAGNLTNISILGDKADNNLIQQNLIGTLGGGPDELGSHTGIYIEGADATRIVDNMVSAHSGNGIEIMAVAANESGRLPEDTVIQGNVIGLSSGQNVVLPNAIGILLSEAVNTQIGGLVAGEGNVVSGNDLSGIRLIEATTGTQIQGNIIGTSDEGNAGFGNGDGVSINSGSHSNLVGGEAEGSRNLIAGNDVAGIYLGSVTPQSRAHDNVVQGNYIGVLADGVTALPNGVGIDMQGGNDNLIGGNGPNAANLISGNGANGITVRNGLEPALVPQPLRWSTSGNQIIGNIIGLNAEGDAALPNLASGIQLFAEEITNSSVFDIEISANLIGGNRLNGITLEGSTVQRNTITGNHIGVNRAGDAPLGNTQDGIYIESSSLNSIGGTEADAGNLISGNKRDGIHLYKTAAAQNTIQGNRIGVSIDGSPLGNARDGVRFASSGPNLVGGDAAGAGNLIAHNGGNGITNKVVTVVSTGKSFLGNRIFANGGLGIDLLQLAQDASDIQAGVTPNDPQDPDVGPNSYQNYPVPTAATNAGINDLAIEANLNSTPNSTFRIEWFASDLCDPSGYGEGQRYLGTSDATTNGAGDATLNLTLANQAQPLDAVLTATATDGAGSTSEFSLCVAINQSPIANDDFAFTQQDSAVLIDVLANDVDPNNDPLTLGPLSDPPHGDVVVQNGQVLYTPDAGFIGQDTFTYAVSDGEGGSDNALVTVTVVPPGDVDNDPNVNDPPLAVDDLAETLVNTQVGIGVLANDVDPEGGVMAVVAFTQPTNGTVQNLGGVLTYTPNADFTGADPLTYTIADPEGLTDSATVTVTVVATPVDQPGVNDPPVAIDDGAVTPINTAVSVLVLSNDFDPDGDALTILSASDPAHGTLQIQNGQILYTPDNDFKGIDSFVYLIGDGQGGFDSATVSLAVGLPAPTALEVIDQPQPADLHIYLPALSQ